MKSNRLTILLIILAVLIFLIWIFSGSGKVDSSTISVPVKRGQFIIDVTTTGELEARSSEKIQGPNPMSLRNARIWQYRIEDIVPDGTVVDSGQWVATLDRSDLDNKIKDQELEVEKFQTQFVKGQLDTTMTLRNARDELVNLQFALEEKQIVVDQSLYEPPATQRQVKIDFDKTERTLKQAIENYSLKSEKAKADMKEVQANLSKAQRQLVEYQDLNKEFVIHAPKSGMVNYKRGWDGKKQGIGAQISSWENVVATLPNLSAMNSKTYVNEIDISKVAVGQKTELMIDAFPDKTFGGEVFEVANMGEQMSNSNAKVFEVVVHIHGYDSIMRPSMTTKNRIITEVIDSVLYIPIECLNANDSVTYVYQGGRRQQVIPGKSNETDIVIKAGLEEDDEVYLIPPEDAETWPIRFLDEATIERFKVVEKDTVQSIDEAPEGPKKNQAGDGQRKNHKNKPPRGN